MSLCVSWSKFILLHHHVKLGINESSLCFVLDFPLLLLLLLFLHFHPALLSLLLHPLYIFHDRGLLLVDTAWLLLRLIYVVIILLKWLLHVAWFFKLLVAVLIV